MGTKGYMEHMKKVNKGLEYMYPSRGKGSNRKNLPENPKFTQNPAKKSVDMTSLWNIWGVVKLRKV